LLAQIDRQLDASELVKVKVHKTSPEDAEVSEIAVKIAEGTTSEIVDVRGRTFTIYRQRKAHETGPANLMYRWRLAQLNLYFG